MRIVSHMKCYHITCACVCLCVQGGATCRLLHQKSQQQQQQHPHCQQRQKRVCVCIARMPINLAFHCFKHLKSFFSSFSFICNRKTQTIKDRYRPHVTWDTTWQLSTTHIGSLGTDGNVGVCVQSKNYLKINVRCCWCLMALQRRLRFIFAVVWIEVKRCRWGRGWIDMNVYW